MDFSALLGNVQRKPGAYGLDGSYREFVAFVNGCDAMQDWLLLDGFREWLAERLGRGVNLVWWELVRQIYLAEQQSVDSEPEDIALCNRMFALIGEFLAREITTPIASASKPSQTAIPTNPNPRDPRPRAADPGDNRSASGILDRVRTVQSPSGVGHSDVSGALELYRQ